MKSIILTYCRMIWILPSQKSSLIFHEALLENPGIHSASCPVLVLASSSENWTPGRRIIIREHFDMMPMLFAGRAFNVSMEPLPFFSNTSPKTNMDTKISMAERKIFFQTMFFRIHDISFRECNRCDYWRPGLFSIETMMVLDW